MFDQCQRRSKTIRSRERIRQNCVIISARDKRRSGAEWLCVRERECIIDTIRANIHTVRLYSVQFVFIIYRESFLRTLNIPFKWIGAAFFAIVSCRRCYCYSDFVPILCRCESQVEFESTIAVHFRRMSVSVCTLFGLYCQTERTFHFISENYSRFIFTI